MEAIRDADQSNTLLDKILHLPVHSQKYAEMASTLANTCYEAELPLSMAAWNCDYATVDTLLEFGASIAAKNCQGDNIFHSLIKVGPMTYELFYTPSVSVKILLLENT